MKRTIHLSRSTYEELSSFAIENGLKTSGAILEILKIKTGPEVEIEDLCVMSLDENDPKENIPYKNFMAEQERLDRAVGDLWTAVYKKRKRKASLLRKRKKKLSDRNGEEKIGIKVEATPETWKKIEKERKEKSLDDFAEEKIRRYLSRDIVSDNEEEIKAATDILYFARDRIDGVLDRIRESGRIASQDGKVIKLTLDECTKKIEKITEEI